MNVEDLPTHCRTCGKKLDVVEVFFNDGYCSLYERAAAQAHQKCVCDTCATPLSGKHVHSLHGLSYCDEHIAPSS